MNSVSLCTDVEDYFTSNSPHLFFWIAQHAIFIFMRIHVTEACETELYLVLINRFWFTHEKNMRSGQDLVVLQGDLCASQVSLAALHGCDKDTILQHAFAIKYHFYCVIELNTCFWSNNVCFGLRNLLKTLLFSLLHNSVNLKLQSTKKNYEMSCCVMNTTLSFTVKDENWELLVASNSNCEFSFE